jgi:uncharacterized membrane protein YeaQ/YmgE (transglycosylase-associated protein family)
MALVRRDEPATRQLSTDGSCNAGITLSITLGTYTEEERMAFLLSPTERQKDWRAIHPYQGKDKIMTLATLLLADINLSLSNVLWWLLVGLVAGFLASRVMRGGGYGLIGDIVVGLIGAFIGGWLAGFLGLGGSSSLIVSIVIAFIGACILLAILRAVTRGASRGSRGRLWRR